MRPFAIVETNSGRVIGTSRYHDIVPTLGRLEIGYTWYGKSWQRSHVNTVCKLLLLRHAFDERSEEHTSELQSLMRISYAVFCLKKKTKTYMQSSQLKTNYYY